MTAEPNSSRWRSSDELLVLHAVRLAGFADTEAIVARFELSAGSVGDTLRVLEGESLIERMAFADSSGWILTDAGKSRDAEMLREELDASGARPVLHATVENFERSMNPLLVRVITEWQLHPSTNRPDSRVEVLHELTEERKGLSDLMAELVARLARFGRYPGSSLPPWRMRVRVTIGGWPAWAGFPVTSCGPNSMRTCCPVSVTTAPRSHAREVGESWLPELSISCAMERPTPGVS